MKNDMSQYRYLTDSLDNKEDYSSTPSSVMCSQHIEVETSVGLITPQYEVEDHGRQQHKPIYFYPNGQLKKVALQEKVEVNTKYGVFPAELLMFYDDGSLKKLFPLNGKLSGYWSEKNECSLAEDLKVNLPSGDILGKIINISFYLSGEIRSITLWPEEAIDAKCSIGNIKTRTGIGYYENGMVRSLEPAVPEVVETPIGGFKAFDNDPEGICGDVNSLQFHQDGTIAALCTISDTVKVILNQEIITFEPSEKSSLCSDLVKITIPLLVEFFDGKVRFNNSKHHEYDIAQYSFKVEPYTKKNAIPSYECD